MNLKWKSVLLICILLLLSIVASWTNYLPKVKAEAPVWLTLTVSCPVLEQNATVVYFGYILQTDRAQINVHSTYEGGNDTQFVGYLPDGYDNRILYAGVEPHYFAVMLPTNPNDWAKFGWADTVTWKVDYLDENDVRQYVSATASLTTCSEPEPIATISAGPYDGTTADKATAIPVATVTAYDGSSCPAQNYDRGTNRLYCYQPGQNGVVPIPPSP